MARRTYRVDVEVTAEGEIEGYDDAALAADIRDRVFAAVAEETPLEPVVMQVDPLVIEEPITRVRLMEVLQQEFGSYLAHDPHDPEKFWKHSADGVMMRLLRDPVGGETAAQARAARSIAILLGAAENWDGGADYLDDIASILHLEGKFPHPGSDDTDDYYQKLERE